MGKAADEPKFLFEIIDATYATLVVDFKAVERISAPYQVDLTLACEDEIEFDKVVGKAAFLTIVGDEEDRYIHGIINKFMQNGSKGRFYLYDARIVPSLWLLSLVQNCRIFQNKKVDDIVKQVLQDRGITSDRFDFKLKNTYPEREYCVQYRETDLNFISRLLEEEGIFYYFEHFNDKHLLIFGDSKVAYKPIKGTAEVVFNASAGMVPENECVFVFAFSRRILSGKVTQKDFNFEKPSLDLTAMEQSDSNQKLEIYDYPGSYLEQDRGKKLTEVRLQEYLTFKEMGEGQTTCVRMIPGFTFKLTDHDRNSFNKEYLIVEVLTTGSQPQAVQEETYSGLGLRYSNEFQCISSAVIFRPDRVTPKPVVEGPQTAMVTGPKGEEIYNDKYGRVKVQFHWDREGKMDEKSSCWVRVASDFAGGQYGIIFTPRIGQEVVVDFLEGDPDRPLITGRVYNADNMPPYTLPDEKTKSTIKTNSSIGGKGFNEIRFEDKKGDEQVFIHAEKDMDIRVKNDRREQIGNDRHLIVKNDKIEKVERDNHIIVARDELKEIKRDNNLKVGGKQAAEISGSNSLTVSGDVIEIFKGKHNEEVTMDYYVKAMNVVIEGMLNLTIKVGANFININPAGIFIQGTMLMFNSGGSPGVGVPGMAVPPAAPLEPKEAADSAAGKDVSYEKTATHKEPDEEDEEKKSWIEIELVDEEGDPVPGEKYKVTLPDNKTVATGTLDEKGYAKISGIDPGTCKITFPNLDKDAWERGSGGKGSGKGSGGKGSDQGSGSKGSDKKNDDYEESGQKYSDDSDTTTDKKA